MEMKTAVILVGHGSPDGQANDLLLQVARLVQQSGCCSAVSAAFLIQGRPTVSEAVDDWQASGVHRLVLCPFFLFPGRHVRRDLPALAAAARNRYPGLEVLVAEPLGLHPKLVDIVCERLAAVMAQGA